MKKGLVVLLLVLASYAVPATLVRAAEEPKPPATEQKPAEPAEKPLEPGWLSLDSSVGAADRWIALNKAAVEGAIGIGISGYLDTSLYLEFTIIRRIPPESAVDIFTGTKTKSTLTIFISRWTNRKRIGALDSIYPLISAALESCWGKRHCGGHSSNKSPSAQLREVLHHHDDSRSVREFNSKAACL